MSVNVFGTSPVATGSKFASPVVRGVVAGSVVVGVFAGYMMLSGGAASLFKGSSGAADPPKTNVNPISAAFKPPPPAITTDAVGRPKVSGPPAMGNGFHPAGGVDEAMAGIESPIDAYTAPARSTSAPTPTDRSDISDHKDHAKAGSLEETLTPSEFSATDVSELKDVDYLLEEGRYLPCTQMSFINSTYAGSVTAIIPVALRGETGDVELLGPGSKIFGTIQRGVANGAEMAFVLWQTITTEIVHDSNGVPHQFRVKVDSPASSALGETGLAGDLDRHLPSKITAVIGVSLLSGVSQGLGSAFEHQGSNSNNASPSINFNQVENGTNSAGNMLAQQFLSRPDVLTRLQGKECTVALVRDVNLKKAYPKLKSILDMQGNRS